MKLKRFYIGFIIFYLIYAAVISLYLFNLKPGYVPDLYKGTVADPTTFMTMEQIIEAHHLDLIYYFTFFLQTPLDFLLLILLMAFSKRLRDKTKTIFKKSFWQIGFYYLIFSMLITLLYLPLELFFYYLNHKYGLSDQSLLSVARDLGISFTLDIVLVVPLLWLFYWVVKKFPKKWWLITWGASIPLTIIAMFLIPVLIMPLYNEYKPLDNKELKAEIQELADEAGIPDAKILEMNMSKQTNTINAFVTGIGSNMQIVIGDTAIKEMTTEEIKFVMAHEIGHYKLKHIYVGLAVSLLITFFVIFGGYLLYNFLIKRFGHLWGVEGQHDLAALPLLLLTISLISFIISPISNFQIRYQENAADEYAIEMTQNKEAAVSAFQTLTKNIKSTGYEPTPIHFFLGTHPRITERIDFMAEYDLDQER
ncbi:M48 family metallopeptidase [Niallia endozanthoxylica]|uniref:M48 family metallopeptidase n=1 Tax=Niallia endozanthoxylica TaxID=2036016 RepID=A0A5J5GXL3_9BACI|nr:M48 family metallopeptidase [Niallia endozanthoxylica]KAA9012112.1 M48 family metallopeptidase [Niallia endozanthoxylica]